MEATNGTHKLKLNYKTDCLIDDCRKNAVISEDGTNITSGGDL